MTPYHPLTNETGQTPERRLQEAKEITAMLADRLEEMAPNEQRFVESP